MVVFGGYNGVNYNDAWTLDLTLYAWTQLTTTGTKPSPRFAHTSILYNGQMVMFGGYYSSAQRYNDAWTLDLTSYAWTQLTTTGTKPSERSSPSSILHNGQMVIFGGVGSRYSYNDAWTLDLTSYAWTELTTSGTKPSVRWGHSSILYNGQMVMFGGLDVSSNYFNDVWTLDLTSYAWNELTTSGTKPNARHYHRSIAYNGQMFMFGGVDNGNKNDAWTLNLTSYAWTELATTGTKPSARNEHSSILYNGLMVMFGGRDSSRYNDAWTLELTIPSTSPTQAPVSCPTTTSANCPTCPVCSTTAPANSLATTTTSANCPTCPVCSVANGKYPWTQLATTGTKPSARYGHSSIVYNEQMVMFGGSNLGVKYKNDAWALNLTSYAWNELETTGTKPSARHGHSSILYNGQMVMFGGWDGSNNYNGAWTLNLTSYAWNELTTTGTNPSARRAHSSILYNGQMVMFGGWDGSNNYNGAWTLNLTSYAWNELTTTGTNPSARRAHSSILYNGQMVMFGGADDSSKNDAWTLDLTTYAWTQLVTSGMNPSARAGHSSILYNGLMVMFGGKDDSGNHKNDAWALDLTSYAWTQLVTTGAKPSARRFPSSILYNGQMLIALRLHQEIQWQPPRNPANYKHPQPEHQ
eukprot:g3281.t1